MSKYNTSIFELGRKSGCSITTPLGDFLFVGGLSFLFIPLILLFDVTASEKLVIYVFVVSLFINYPHFMHSYQLLYTGFISKIHDQEASWERKSRLLLSGVIVPTGLFSFLLIAVNREDQNLLSYGASVMFFLVGWHYVKQGYGVLMALSARKRVFFNAFEKKILLVNAYLCWICLWASKSDDVHGQLLLGINYSYVNFLAPLLPVIAVLVCLSSFAAISVFWLKYEKQKQYCFNGMVGYFCAVYVWLFLVMAYPIFLLIFPALHSLQYLLFVWKMQYEKEILQIKERQEGVSVHKRMRHFFAMAIVFGSLSFWVIPSFIDAFLDYNVEVWGAMPFVYVFMIFINIHHYFIDFAIWRRDNPDMKHLMS